MRYPSGQMLVWHVVAPWCSGYHYFSTSLKKAWTQALRRLKSCSRRVGDPRWWGSLTMIPAGNKAKPLSSVNHATKKIHNHYHHHQLPLWMPYLSVNSATFMWLPVQDFDLKNAVTDESNSRNEIWIKG